jgi:DinB superfamily
MPDPQTKAEIIDQLRLVQQGVSDTAQAIPAAHFYQGTAESWSASDYLKHLLLAVKPFAKGISLPREQIRALFGQPDHASRSYADLVTVYQDRLATGLRAEDVPIVMPTGYRMPEGMADVQAYLVQTWNEAHTKLFDGLAGWSEADLDTHQFPHAALGLLTAREILFFTLYHNRLHWGDIRVAGGVVMR